MKHVPFLLRPVGKDYLWGGERLKTAYHKQIGFDPVGGNVGVLHTSGWVQRGGFRCSSREIAAGGVAGTSGIFGNICQPKGRTSDSHQAD